MNKSRLIQKALGAIGFHLFVAATPAQAAEEFPVFPLADVIAQVKRELAAAQSTPGAVAGLKLDKVELSFALSRTTDANGKISIGVPAIGAEVGGGAGQKAESVSSLLVELAPPKPLAIMAGVDATNLGLTQAIVNVRRQLNQGLADEPKLLPRKVSISLKFTLQKSAGPAGQIKLVVISIGGGVSISSADTNSIVLTFTPSDAP